MGYCKLLSLKGLLLIVGLVSGLPVAPATEVVDTVVRYVNGEVLTLNEVRERIRAVVERMRLAGQMPPSTAEFRALLMQQAVREETADMLLAQEAVKLGAPVDERLIRREVIEENLRTNRFPTIADENREIERRIREARIDAVEAFYLHKQAGISPRDVADAYQERVEMFRRPARARVWRIVMRPTELDDLAGMQRHLTDLVFKGVRRAATPGLAEALGEDLRQRFLAAEGDEAKCAVLVGELEQVLAAVPAEPAAGDRELLERIERAVEAFRDQRGADQIRAQMQAMRDELVAIDDPEARLERFQALAAAHTAIGREQEEDGDAGLKEPGDLGGEYDEYIFSLEPFELSPVFATGDAWCLLMTSELRPAEQKSLRQVSVELRHLLERERRQVSREELVRKLWDKAVLRDISDLDLDRLLREAGAYEGTRTADGGGQPEAP